LNWVKDQAGLVALALVKFNKEVFVGLVLIDLIIGALISMDPFRSILQLKQTWQQLSSSANSHIIITTISQATELLHHHHSNSHPPKATSIPAQVNSIPPLWTLGAQPCKAQPQSSLNFEPSLAPPVGE
jgi:hypothetical protein